MKRFKQLYTQLKLTPYAGVFFIALERILNGFKAILLVLWSLVGKIPMVLPIRFFYIGMAIIQSALIVQEIPSGFVAIHNHYNFSAWWLVALFGVLGAIIDDRMKPELLFFFTTPIFWYSYELIQSTIEGSVSILGTLAALYVFCAAFMYIVALRRDYDSQLKIKATQRKIELLSTKIEGMLADGRTDNIKAS